MTGIKVRPALPSDFPFIAALEKECFADPWSENAVDEAYRFGTVFFIAEADGKTVGYAGVKPVLDEGYISNVAVTGEYRRKGVGAALMTSLYGWATENGIATVTLEVRASNTAAVSLYSRFGYKQVGKRRNFYTHPDEDALIMTVKVG